MVENSDVLASPDQQNIKKLVQSALRRRRTAIVYAIARKLLTVFESSAPTMDTGTPAKGMVWKRIESLSQLRAQVGGRFQNLKQKWVAAGFPLREHRGDRKAEAQLDYDGWIELASWIGKQGYEVRLAPEDEQYLFEVRELEEPTREQS